MAAGEVVVKRTRIDFGKFEEDVIVEILARLPVKSLMRFRCVCKPWRALISASCFVKKHFSYQEKGITESPRRLIFNLDPPLAFDCEAFKTSYDDDDRFSGPFIHSNCLCVCALPTETNCINLWMMKEYGVKESWTQVVQFSLENDFCTKYLRPVCISENDFCRKYLRPVCILENGVVLIDVSGTHKGLVVLSNLEDETFMHCVEAQDNCFETVIYQETLVSPRLYDPMVDCKRKILS